MEPYVLIVYLAMKAGDAALPRPQTFVRPSRADCLLWVDRFRRMGDRARMRPGRSADSDYCALKFQPWQNRSNFAHRQKA